MEKEETYSLHCSKKQLAVIQDAVELYSRIGMGQYREILDIQFSPISPKRKEEGGQYLRDFYSKWIGTDKDQAEKILDQIFMKRANLPFGSYHGINSLQISGKFRTAFDIMQVIRHKFWKEGGCTPPHVVSSSILKTSREDLPLVSKELKKEK